MTILLESLVESLVTLGFVLNIKAGGFVFGINGGFLSEFEG